MTKIYCYNEPIFQGDAIVGNEVIELSEQDILSRYWNHWSSLMTCKYGEGHELITEENCIEDFLVINWAWEKPL